MTAGADAGALGVLDPAGAFLRRADLGLRAPTLGVFLLVAALPDRCCCRGSRPAWAPAITAALFVALFAPHFGLMTGAGMWLQLMLPRDAAAWSATRCSPPSASSSPSAARRSRTTRSAESNRMLGLAFQGQGQLDMAFDKFRKVPLDDAVMDNLYNLALDFERKRQFNKAESGVPLHGRPTTRSSATSSSAQPRQAAVRDGHPRRRRRRASRRHA